MTCSMNRRTFTALSGITAAHVSLGGIAQAADSVRMFKNLGAGHLGVDANQRESIEYAARFGFGGTNPNVLELEKFSEGERKDIVSLLKGKNLRWGANGLPVQFRQHEDQFREGMRALPTRAAILQEVGVTRVATWVMPGHDELTYRENFERHRTRLRECALVLRDHGIRLGLEFVGPQTLMNRFRYPFIHTQQEMMELCHAIDTGNMGLLLDAWHWYTSHGTVEELKTLTNETIVNVHVNDAPAGREINEQIDSERELPGATGVIDLKSFMEFLVSIDYDGPVTVEPFNQPLREMDNEEALQKTIESLNHTFGLIGA